MGLDKRLRSECDLIIAALLKMPPSHEEKTPHLNEAVTRLAGPDRFRLALRIGFPTIVNRVTLMAEPLCSLPGPLR